MPPAAPTVQSLNDIIGQITAAQAPEQATIDSNISANDQSGNAQVAGLNQAQTNAFGQINQNASDKGLYFSGYTPQSEATYTGSTYLPALAKLQNTIATTRNTLLGQKADLQTQANIQALTTQQGEQKDLDSYNQELQSESAAAALQKQEEQAAAAQAQITANNTASNNAAEKGNRTTNSVGGYEFTDAKGNPINASAYAALNNTSVANVLSGSKDAGDAKFINDYNSVQNAIAQGTVTSAQGQAALRYDYPNLGNITL